MSSNEWEFLGESLKNLVEDAVKSQDFKNLTNSVRGVVQTASRNVAESLNAAEGKMNQWQVGNEGIKRRPVTPPVNRQPQTTVPVPVKRNQNELFAPTTSSGIAGGILMGVGYGIGSISCVITAITGIGILAAKLAGTLVIGSLAPAVCSLVVSGGLLTVGGYGKRMLGQTRRLKTYISTLRGREYVELKKLSGAVNKSVGFVKKDVKRMIRNGWIREGHLDQQETCLMITDDMYREYLKTVEDSRIQKEKQALLMQEEQQRLQKEEELTEREKQIRDTLKAGNEFVEKIRYWNEEIPGEDISQTISRIEVLVKRIFERIEKHPENISDIRKMLEYYLPTTIKLLEAYAELDKQPVQGENIRQSKKEIEETLDTLNAAYEKLLDELFKDTAWDVSSDIAVLNTVLAQDGLAEKDF